MTLEDRISQINESLFFKEFSFSKNKFSPPQSSELEFADHVIWLDDLLITFQLKERDLSGTRTEQTESNWFEKKIIGNATKQIRDTLSYLNTHEEIKIANERGHKFNVISGNISKRIHVVSYSPHDLLPKKYRTKKFYLSSTADCFIHLIPEYDYQEMCKTFITPAEIGEYLEFRKEISTKYEGTVNALPEQAIVGQFLQGNLEDVPDITFAKYLDAFIQRSEEFDCSHILRIFADRILTTTNPHDYYQILKELAKLKRTELKEFKFRYDLCIKGCRENAVDLPYRMSSPRTGCGFVFIIVPSERVSRTQITLQMYTEGHKYEQKLSKCIGITFSHDGKMYDINWGYIEEEWAYDSELEQILKENFPFRTVRGKYFSTYQFDNDLLH
jgi:hypothetical protein